MPKVGLNLTSSEDEGSDVEVDYEFHSVEQDEMSKTHTRGKNEGKRNPQKRYLQQMKTPQRGSLAKLGTKQQRQTNVLRQRPSLTLRRLSPPRQGKTPTTNQMNYEPD